MPITNSQTEINRYLKMRDVCECLSVTDETICKWIRNEGMPAHKIGKQWLFIQKEIDAWVIAHNEKGGRGGKASKGIREKAK